MTNTIRPDAALILVDVQTAFDDPSWGRRNNPEAEANIGRLVRHWARTGRPTVRVRHISTQPGSPLGPDQPGQAFKPEVADLVPDLEISKNVHSSFHGAPDLHAWLTGRDIRQLVVAGIQTNRCVETTARLGGDLGYDVLLPIDATYTFDLVAPDGTPVSADEIARVTAANLHNDFAQIWRTADLLATDPITDGVPVGPA